jgi:hypothetical protein
MDPVTIVTLVGSCTAIAQRLAATLVDLNDLRGRYKNVEQSIVMLSSQVALTNATISQLREWLEKPMPKSSQVNTELQSSLDACELVVSGIQDHISRVKVNSASGKLRFTGRIRHLWDENTVKEHERKLNSQFQVLILFLQVFQM